MPLTIEERRANLAKGRATAAANRAARPATPAPPPEAEEDDGDDVISQLLNTLQAVKSKKVKQAEALRQLGTLLDQLNPKDHPELVDDPTIAAFVEQVTSNRIQQAEKLGLPPGTQVGTGMGQDGVPWHYTDLPKYCRKPLPGHEKDWMVALPGHEGEPLNISNSRIIEEFSEPDLITFIPNQYIPITWNGLTCYFHADEPLTTYKVFYDTWMESKRLGRIGDQHKAYMFGSSDVLPRELGTGDQGVATARVRAYMAMGSEPGKGRITVGYPGDVLFGIRDTAGGSEAQSGEAPA